MWWIAFDVSAPTSPMPSGTSDGGMGRLARPRILINDLARRHPLAYAGIYGLHAPAAGFGDECRTTAPSQFLRVFEARELQAIATEAGARARFDQVVAGLFGLANLSTNPLNRRP